MTDMTVNTPGVKIREIPFNTPTIAGVSTAIPLMIGEVARTEVDGTRITGIPYRITGIDDFAALFGRPRRDPDTEAITLRVVKTVDLEGSLDPDGVKVSFAGDEIAARTPGGPMMFYWSVHWYFKNGGGPCWVIGIDPEGAAAEEGGDGGGDGDGGDLVQPDAVAAVGTPLTQYSAAIARAEKLPEVTILVIENTIGASDLEYAGLLRDAMASCVKMKDRFAICDMPNTGPAGSIGVDALAAFRGSVPSVAVAELKYLAAYAPMLETSYPIPFTDASVLIAASSTLVRRNAEGVSVDAAGDPLDGADPAPLFPGEGDAEPADIALSDPRIQGALSGEGEVPNAVPGETAVYDAVRAFLESHTIYLPPSPAIAGIYARVDRQQGVHYTPANVAVQDVVGPAIPMDDAEQALLNVDAASGKSINAIRSFLARGTLVWGGRTQAGNNGDWKYIGVRRTVIYLETSIRLALTRYVFAPNTVETWVAVQTMIEGFLRNEWRAGRLAGSTPEGSFQVAVGLGSTMTQEDIVAGRLNILVALALVRPAEFIYLNITQMQQG